MRSKKNLYRFLYTNKIDIIVILFLLLFSPLFFYNLGGWSLEDFDEGWYGEIARNITVFGNPALLNFNSRLFTEHPPLGFDLMAISMLASGPTEFAVRLPSAISGFLSLVFIYLIGKNLFNRSVGIASAFILVSCVWFIFRSRSGNLDAPLVFFYTLTFYFTIKLAKNAKYAYGLSLAFTALMLTKTLIGLTFVPAIATYVLLNKIKIPPKHLIISAVILVSLLSVWFFTNLSAFGLSYPNYIIGHALRSQYHQNINFAELLRSQTFTYLHFGVGKWYYPALISLLIAIPLSVKNKNLIPLILWIFVPVYGFLQNAKTEIWHLLPIYVPLALLISYVWWKFLATSLTFKASFLIPLLTITPIFLVAIYQMNSFKNNVKLFDRYESGLAYTAKQAKNLSEKLYLDTMVTVPAVAAFYSQKNVQVVQNNVPELDTLKEHMQYAPRPFLLLVEKWKLDLDEIDKNIYQIVAEKDGWVLILVKDPIPGARL